ncbi:LysE family transporter [Nonomuraea sp. NPDC050536]|uniref:LysE family transporter n=1 Tax=Nonomuraea sp. NPDC050536 TaxID=3364366 RepID=UPI0037C67BA9
MVQSLLAAVAVLALLTVVPGPDMAVVSSSALSGGRRAATRTAAGVMTGLLVWGMLAVVGLAAVLDRFRPVLNRPRIRRLLERVTGTVLIGFGLRLATEGR